jgi:hypothetical protein
MFSLQTIGGGPIVPLYYLCYIFSSRSDAYFRSGRFIMVRCAKAILPSVILGYIIPTIAMYYPWNNNFLQQNMIAFWQFAPLVVNILTFILELYYFMNENLKGVVIENPDVKYLNRIYIFAGAITAINHIGTLLICLTSSNPQLSLRYVFLPDSSKRLISTTLDVHYIFQIDEWWSFGPSLIWCWIAIFDIQRLNGSLSVLGMAKVALGIAAGTLLLGPGATMALVWYRREEMLVQLERAEKKKLAAKNKKSG